MGLLRMGVLLLLLLSVLLSVLLVVVCLLLFVAGVSGSVIEPSGSGILLPLPLSLIGCVFWDEE